MNHKTCVQVASKLASSKSPPFICTTHRPNSNFLEIPSTVVQFFTKIYRMMRLLSPGIKFRLVKELDTAYCQTTFCVELQQTIIRWSFYLFGEPTLILEWHNLGTKQENVKKLAWKHARWRILLVELYQDPARQWLSSVNCLTESNFGDENRRSLL